MASIGSSNVRVQSDTELVSYQGWTLRTRAAAERPARILLVVHGWTGDENSMWVFVRHLAPTYWIVAPRAPYATQPSGYSWRPQEGSVSGRPSFADLAPAVDPLLSLVDSYSADNSVDASIIDAMGFSQGAALITALALLHPERVDRVGLLAGFVPPGAESLLAQRPLMGRQFFVAHGTLDERVKIEYARLSVRALEQAGAHVTYCEDEVGHKLSARCLKALEAFFA